MFTSHTELQIWILGTIVTVLATILTFVMKIAVNQVIRRLDAIVIALEAVRGANTLNEERIKSLQADHARHAHTLELHDGRIRGLEFKASQTP